MIYVYLPGRPNTSTAQQKGVFVVGGRPRFYTKKKVKDAHNQMVAALRDKAPLTPLSGPVRVKVRFTFNGKPKGRTFVYHQKRPDVDNLLKGVLDALAPAGWIEDDSQVVELEASKQVNVVPRTEVWMAVATEQQPLVWWLLGDSPPPTTQENASGGLLGAKKGRRRISQKAAIRVKGGRNA